MARWTQLVSGPAAVTRAEVAMAANHLGLAGKAFCLHASLRSFPRLEEGPATLVEALLETGITVLSPSMANEAFSIPAPRDDRPARNGIDYAEKDASAAARPWPGLSDIYDPSRTDVDVWLGATAAYVAAHPDRRRTRRAAEFCALGPLADELIDAEEEADVFGPLRQLARCSGWVLLAGVGLTSMTILHLAEVTAGRRPFIRWMRAPDGSAVRVRGGECSRGFDRLDPVLAPVERRTVVGSSVWRAFPAAAVVELVASTIRARPEITHCDDEACIECADAIAGGPLAD